MSAPPSALRDLLVVSDAIAGLHGVPPQAVLLQTLALGSALAGDLIASQHAGGPPLPAKVSLLIRTPDAAMPPWIAREWRFLKERQEHVANSGPDPKYTAMEAGQLRRRKRILTTLNNGSTTHAATIDRLIESAKNHKTYQAIHIVGDGKCPALAGGDRSICLAAGGQGELRKLLPGHSNRLGYWTMLSQRGGLRSNLLGWIGNHDWPKWVREVGMKDYGSFGLVVECSAMSGLPDPTAGTQVAAAALLQRLEHARFGSIRFAYRPCDVAKDLLHRHAERTRTWLESLPQSTRDHALPDRHLAWHLSAILAAMCAGSKEGDPQHQVLQATRLGIALAAWSTRQHLHHFRQAFPADDLGPFVGQSLSILRFLSATPSSVRQIQRRLRGLNKEACLWTLRRGVAAGLALEPEPERFTSVPLPGQELADFVAEFELPEAKPQDFSPNSTDGTDKPSS